MKMFAAACAALLICGTAQAQVNLTEGGTDAGQTLATARSTAAGPAGVTISSISGNLSSATDVDLFRIYIANPGSFSATTINTGTGQTFDTNLFLFNASGQAIATNDDANGADFRAALPSGNALYRDLSAGNYFLAVGQSGNEAVNSNNQLLFAMYTGGDTTSIRGAAGGTNPSTLFNFNGNTSFADAGAYRIDLTGVTTGAVAAAPEPAAWGLMLAGFAGVGASLRRRRRRVTATA